jgi:predicted RNA-binding protein with PUA-like domain
MSAKKRYWLFKSEPETFGIDHLAKRPRKTEPWDGVRNYQARNFLRDEVKKGDAIFFYHSACKEPGIVGLCEAASGPEPDQSARDPGSPYYDEKATDEDPRWYVVQVRLKEIFAEPITLQQLKGDRSFADMLVVQRGQRLSIQPVETKHARKILKLAGLS